MFSTQKAVIYVSRDKFKACLVGVSSPYQVRELIELDWTPEKLSDILKQIKDKLKTNRVRLLLSSDLSYVVNVTIPSDTKKADERQSVAMSVAGEIPEILDNQDWDYKLISQDKKQRKLVVFAPVKDKFAIIIQAFTSMKINIEAVEPEDIAKIRHENPIIGLALKQDLKGKDEEVLNLTLTDAQPALSQKISFRNILLPLFVLVIFFLLLVVVVVFFRQDKTRTETKAPIATITTVSVTPSPVPSPDMSIYSVQVLNGSGVAGEASAVELLLTSKGFNKFTLGNAKSYNYKDTEVSLKTNVTDEVFKAINDALSKMYNVVKSASSLPQNSDYDILVTVGKKK